MRSGAGPGSGTTQALIEARVAARLAAGGAFFGAEAERIARCCHRMAERFAREGRLIALGPTPAARSDARHVSVEFVHPVIVGKRALPALALTAEGGPLRPQLDAIADPADIVIGFGLDGPAAGAAETADCLELAAERGCMTIGFGPGVAEGRGGGWAFEVPSEDPCVRQELVETLYHVLWELVHVFFEHRGLLEGRSVRRTHDSGGSSFLYPFLGEQEADLDSVLEDVRASVLMKATEVGELRERTAGGSEAALIGAAEALGACFTNGGRVLAFGNGGSATDAMDLVADLHSSRGLPPRPAIDLTEDTPIITAVANDVGVAAIFQRQLIAWGRPGDVAVAFSTSGGSENLIAGLAQARKMGIATVAFVGYDGGRVAAEELADHVIVSPSQNIPRIQEAQATAYHLLRELAEGRAGP